MIKFYGLGDDFALVSFEGLCVEVALYLLFGSSFSTIIGKLQLDDINVFQCFWYSQKFEQKRLCGKNIQSLSDCLYALDDSLGVFPDSGFITILDVLGCQ